MTGDELRRIVGQNIKARRKAAGLTQAGLAVAVGITQGAVAHYEIGRSYPNADLMAMIADALQCPPDTLLREEMAELTR